MFRCTVACVFFKQDTAYEVSECDWSSVVCSFDLDGVFGGPSWIVVVVVQAEFYMWWYRLNGGCGGTGWMVDVVVKAEGYMWWYRLNGGCGGAGRRVEVGGRVEWYKW